MPSAASTSPLPILLLISIILSIHLPLAHYVFNLPVNPFTLPEPLRSLFILAVFSLLLNLFRTLLVHKIFLSAFDVDTKEDEQWWNPLARLLHWLSFAFLWDVILMMDRPKEEDWLDGGSQVAWIIVSCVVEFYLTGYFIVTALGECSLLPVVVRSKKRGRVERVLNLLPLLCSLLLSLCGAANLSR